MQPLCATAPRRLSSTTDQCPSNPLALEIGIHRRIEQERVCPTVAGDVDKPDQALTGVGADIHRAAHELLREVTLLMSGPRPHEQPIECSIVGCRADCISNYLR